MACGYLRGMHPTVQALASCHVLDLTGTPVRLGALWEEGPAVLVFLRHYG